VIGSHEEYLQAHAALRDLEEALAALRQRLGTSRASLFETMAQDYIDSIIALRQDIDVYIGLMSAQAARAPLWMGLEGDGLSPENILTSLLSVWLARLRRSVIALASFAFSRGTTGDRPSRAIAEACDFRLMGFLPGSLRIGLEIPQPDQLLLFPRSGDAVIAVRTALADLLEKASELTELQHSVHRVDLSSEELSTRDALLLKQVLRLIPGRRERVRAIVFEGALVPRTVPVRLNASLRSLLASRLGPTTEPDQIEELEGMLREIDLDQRHFILRDRPEDQPDITVFFRPNLQDDAKRALDQRVRVEASRDRVPRRRLNALVIEILEDA